MRDDIIFFQWCDLPKELEFGYTILEEAERMGQIHICTGPSLLRKPRIDQIHRYICFRGGFIKRLWYQVYLSEIHLKRKEKYILFFTEWHPSFLNLEFYNWLKKKYNVILVLVIRNMIENKENPCVRNVELSKLKEIFDLIVTDEKVDGDVFDLLYAPDPFSMPLFSAEKKKVDICFTGTDKGRAELLNSIAMEACKRGLSCDFRLVGCDKEYSNIKKCDWQSYKDIIQQDMSSNCILEILQPGQKSYTTRLQEAVCLKRKLLTNNPNITQEEYYIPEYVKVFDKVEDIDWDFVQKSVQVDYGYDGRYSPVRFIENVIKELERRRVKND